MLKSPLPLMRPLLFAATLALTACQPGLRSEAPPAETLDEVVFHPPIPREPPPRARKARDAQAGKPADRSDDTAPDEIIEPPLHLLARMSSGFGFEDADNARIRTELAWFIRNDAYIERVFTRGSLYLPHILDEIEARGLPSELALVPLIESAYDPFAYSHGRAAGL